MDAFFLSGRTLPWYIVGTSMIATSFAADTPDSWELVAYEAEAQRLTINGDRPVFPATTAVGGQLARRICGGYTLEIGHDLPHWVWGNRLPRRSGKRSKENLWPWANALPRRLTRR